MRGFLPCLGLALLTAQAAQAQGGPPRGPWGFQTTGAAAHRGAADLDDGGDVSVSRFYAEAGVTYAFDRATRAGLSVGYGVQSYDFGGGASLGGAGAPWGDIRELRVSAPIFFSPADNVTAIVIPSVRWYAEDGADLDDGRTEGVLAGFSYRFSDSLSIGPGVGVFSELGDGTAVFPILLVDWAVTDRVTLSTGAGIDASQGPGLSLTYALNDALRVGVTGRYENVRFALDGDGAASDGIGETESFPLVATVAYAPTPFVNLSAFVGAEFEGRLTLRDASGNRLARDDYDVAPLIGLAARVRF